MNHEYDIPADDLARLADDCGIEPGYRGEFYRVMNVTAHWYSITKDIPPDDIVKVKGQIKKLKPKVVALIKALNGFEEVLRGFDNLSRNPIEERRGIGLCRYKDSPGAAKSYRALVIADAEKWDATASIILTEVGNLPTGGGDPVLDSLLRFLIYAYKAAGENVGVSRSTYSSGEYSGPMFRFIERSLEIFGIEKQGNKSLGGRIYRVRENMKPNKLSSNT